MAPLIASLANYVGLAFKKMHLGAPKDISSEQFPLSKTLH
jgi:hypothetical protein